MEVSGISLQTINLMPQPFSSKLEICQVLTFSPFFPRNVQRTPFQKTDYRNDASNRLIYMLDLMLGKVSSA